MKSPSITSLGDKSKGNDDQPEKLFIVKQILFVRTVGYVQRTVWRICILMLGHKGFNSLFTEQSQTRKHSRPYY